MVYRRRIDSEQDPLFAFCWGLYQDAFPKEERREIDYHIETMCIDRFHCDVALDNEEPIGILFWWDLEEFTFVEHLATSSEVRGRGLGDTILRDLISASDKPILLEVEHPTDDISRRRIGFYERIGFILNEHEYQHPSYQQQKDQYVSLMVMTYPRAVEIEELQRFMRDEFPTIHFRSFR